MKIGILTFHRGPNYGGFLQAWHMREAIRSLGHEATVINYQNPAHYHGERIKPPALNPGSIKGFFLHAAKSLPFPAFVNELSDHAFTTDPEKIDWQSYTSVVVGADIVWDFSNKKFGLDPAFYGALACQANTRFVAFAPSCGEANVAGALPEYVSSGIRRFSSIHVRDESTADLAEKATGDRPSLVVDPTWLQDDPVVEYRKRPKQPYALIYGQGMNPARTQTLSQYCKNRGLKIVASGVPHKTADQQIFSINPFEWVDLFRHAECIITSTFHGLLYAIKYNKPLVFMVSGTSRSKTRLALERCNLYDRVVGIGDAFTEEYLQQALSPSNPTHLPESWINDSKDLLKSCLQTPLDEKVSG